jgi:hypothetical protein
MVVAVVIIVSGVAGFAAYESHVVSITAHLVQEDELTPRAEATGTPTPGPTDRFEPGEALTPEPTETLEPDETPTPESVEPAGTATVPPAESEETGTPIQP